MIVPAGIEGTLVVEIDNSMEGMIDAVLVQVL
jgi:hypothetical protein